MTSVKQNSFSGGELSPALYGRVDLERYDKGLRQCRNFLVARHGGVYNRPGTEYVASTKTAANRVRFIPFVFNADQSYILEFGYHYIRFYRNAPPAYAGPVPITVSGVSAYGAGTPYVIGNLVSNGGVNYYCIAATTGNAPPNGTYWYALTGSIYEIPTPYATADLQTLQYAQSGDVLTLVHPDYAPRDLSRTAHTTWVLSVIVFAPTQVGPTSMSVTGTVGANTYKYHVTAINTSTEEESLALVGTGTSLAAATETAPHSISWTVAAGINAYNVYMELNGVPGFVGVSYGNSFTNTGIDPDFYDTPPVARNPFVGAGNYPSVVGYYQQRLMLANTNNNPEGIYGSRSGLRKNFTTSTPLQDDDTVTFKVSGRQVNEVRHLPEGDGTLLALTAGGEWSVPGDTSGILTPTAINPKQHSFNGSNEVAPINVGGNVLHIQARGGMVRDLAFELLAEGYRGSDLTIFSSHLFEGHEIVDWAYQQIPQSIVWAVREDGVLLGLTYVREHQLWAWHRHDFTNGWVENVAVIPEGDEDVVYLSIRRVINSNTVRYVERMATRKIDDVVDSIFMDSALSYDGRNTTVGHTMTLSGGSTWGYMETLTLTSSAAFFAAGDVGNEIHLTDANGVEVKCRITAFTSNVEVSCKPHKTVPVAMRNTAISDWAKAVDSLGGLSHLEGEEVSIFADRYVIGSPNNAAYGAYTVSGSSVTLEDPQVVIHVGLPITSDIETLDIDTIQGETLADKYKCVGKVSFFVEGSRGIFVGSNPPADDTVAPLDGLDELKIRETENYDDPIALATAVVSINIRPEWNSHGRVFVRQVDPIPLSILSVVPAGFIPFRK